MAGFNRYVPRCCALALVMLAGGCADTYLTESAPTPLPSDSIAAIVVDDALCPVNSAAGIGTGLVRIRNRSTAARMITATDLQDPTGSFRIRELTSRLVPADGTATLVVDCQHRLTEFASATLSIVSTDITGNAGIINQSTLRTTPANTTLQVSVERVSFGQVFVGESANLEFNIANRGITSAEIVRVEFTNDYGVFSVLPPRHPVLRRDVPTPISVTFEPRNRYPVQTALAITHTATPTGAEITEYVEVVANEPKPCISVSHEDGFDFGEVTPGTRVSETFEIHNCSHPDFPVDLVVGEITLIPDAATATAGTFNLVNPTRQPTTLGVDDRLLFDVEYDVPLNAVDSSRAVVRIDSNDLYKSRLYVDVEGQPGPPVEEPQPPTGTCPDAQLRCSRFGESTPLADGDDLLAGSQIQCSALDSRAASGTINGWFWAVFPTRPEVPVNVVDDGLASIRFPQAGDYTVNLQVIDDRGVFACEPATLNLTVTEPGFRFEVFWGKPAEELDPATGEDADLDLHFVHLDNGCWNDPLYDANQGNRSPDWGTVGDPRDNPLFNALFPDEPGVERIRYLNPPPGSYRIGVEYHEDLGLGAVIVVMRLHVFGFVTFDIATELTTVGEFWDIGTITWPAGDFEPADAIYPTIAAAPCR